MTRLNAIILLLAVPISVAGDDVLDYHDDYYLGFSQGVYYGLMLAGVEYETAWCMKSELEYESANLGAGGEFQARIEKLLEQCRGGGRQ